MADLSITAANVVADTTGLQYVDGIAGETLTAGQPTYKKAADGLFWKADANATGTETSVVNGIALNGATAGQPVRCQNGGTITIGATVASGAVYVLSGAAGGIAPVADLASGWRTSILAIGISTTKVMLAIKNSGYAVP